MPVHNADIAAIFDEIAELLAVEGDNPFRIRAYRNAARTLRDLGREVGSMLEQGENLTALPGIGEDLAAKIQEIIQTGTTPLLGKLRKKVPPALTELLHLPALARSGSRRSTMNSISTP
jgi:DNA polymerase (family 10)